MSFDSVANFIKVTPSTGYSAGATSIVLDAGQGATLPLTPFNMVWWNASSYPDPSNDPNVEIVRITIVSTDTLTVTRAQEGTVASAKNTAGATYSMILGPTAKTITDIESAINTKQVVYLIASSSSPTNTKAIANYVCDGVDDDVEVNAAITAIIGAGTGGGKIVLSEGQFNFGATANMSSSYINIEGAGIGATLVKTQAGSNANPFTLSGTGNIHCSIRRMQIDCNSANNTFGSGIHINTPWSNYDSEHVFEDLLITNCNNNGVEAAQFADTRAMQFLRVHVKGVSGNGFYFPFPSITDSTFDTCICDLTGLNGFYQGGANNHHINCKMFYCGTAGGNNHGFYILGYTNYWECCEAQDNYQSGFYGDQVGGDPTYKNFSQTFVNCVADSNGQNGGSTYCKGIQGIGVKQWQIIGGVFMNRPYGGFWQNDGISFETNATTNYVSGITAFGNNTANFSDTSGGNNYVQMGSATLSAAAAGTTGTISQPMVASVITLTPTGNLTINAVGGGAGQTCSFSITSSGMYPYTITFGTHFKSTGTLSTGSVAGKVFVIEFQNDGTNWNEVARTTAM